jgi:hypothetical protein
MICEESDFERTYRRSRRIVSQYDCCANDQTMEEIDDLVRIFSFHKYRQLSSNLMEFTMHFLIFIIGNQK